MPIHAARRSFLLSAAASLIGALSLLAIAQGDFPKQKPITLVVPFPPGGSTDTLARALMPKLQQKFGQPVIVDNKPGATGTVGAAQVKRAAPDGYTFLVTSLGPLVIAPHLIKTTQYDPQKDFDPITVAVQAPNVLVVPAQSPHKSVADVLAFAKANPGRMTFAVMPSSLPSNAAVRMSDTRAALEAQYAESPAEGSTAERAPIAIMRPCLARRMVGSTARRMLNAARTLRFIILSQVPSSVASIGSPPA